MTEAAGISGTIKFYWHGHGPLLRAFWLWGVLGSWLLAAFFLTFTRA